MVLISKIKPLSAWMKLLFLLFILIIIMSCSDSERKKSKIKYIENPLVQKSLKEYVTPIMNSFEIEKLKKWGFNPPYNLDKNTFEEKYGIQVIGSTQQTKTEMDLGYMEGSVYLEGNYGDEDEHMPDYFNNEIIFLHFVKLSKNESWKLITYEGHIENYKSRMENNPEMIKSSILRIVSPEIQVYIKSHFKTITSREHLSSSSMKIIMDDYLSKK